MRWVCDSRPAVVQNSFICSAHSAHIVQQRMVYIWRAWRPCRNSVNLDLDTIRIKKKRIKATSERLASFPRFLIEKLRNLAIRLWLVTETKTYLHVASFFLPWYLFIRTNDKRNFLSDVPQGFVLGPVVITALRALQAVCLSARLSVSVGQTRDLWQNEINMCQYSCTTWKTIHPSFVTRKMVCGEATPSTWQVGSNWPRCSESIFARSASAVTPSEKVQLTLIGSLLRAFQWA